MENLHACFLDYQSKRSWLSNIIGPSFSDTLDTFSAGWNYRQKEIDELKKHITRLENELNKHTYASEEFANDFIH